MSQERSTPTLESLFQGLDRRLRRQEALLADSPSLDDTLPESEAVTRALLRAYAGHAGKIVPETDDLLPAFKVFVKGDPSLNAVRDNIRELVFYRNCLEQGRTDALPPAAEKMAVRTARHVYLYLRSRCEQEGAFGR